MSFSFEVTGMEELLDKLALAEKGASKAVSVGLYDGAGAMADEVTDAVQGIATEKFRYKVQNGKTRLPSPEEKAVLLQARKGVAKFRNDGTRVDTSVGFQNGGYGLLAGKAVPIPQIANAINSGTSFMKKQPFFRKAVARASGRAQAAIEQKILEEAEELLS